MASHHTLPALHNAMWPGLVGKGGPGAEPPIDLDTMLCLTAAAQVNGTRFDGVDLFLFDPHVSIDASDDDLERLADKIASKGLVVGSLVAPVWPPTGGGSAMGSNGDRRRVSHSGPQGLCDREEAEGPRHPPLRHRPDRLRRRARRIGRRIRPATRRGSPRPSGRRPTLPRTTASGSRPKGRSAGAGCTAWRATSSCSRWSTGPRPSASRLTWRTHCCSRWATTRRTIESCRTTSSGRISARSMKG